MRAWAALLKLACAALHAGVVCLSACFSSRVLLLDLLSMVPLVEATPSGISAAETIMESESL
jgi:hypothetical protein